MNAHNRHEQLSRRYPARTFSGNAPPPPWFAGDVPAPDVVGWVMTVVVPSLGESAHLVGTLALRRPWKGDVQYVVEEVDLSHGGQAFVPWPTIELRIADTNEMSGNPSTVLVGFEPVLRGDPGAPGIEATLYGRRVVGATTGGADVTFPLGATDYRVEPAASIAGDFTVVESGCAPGGGERTWARWKVSESTAQTPGVHNGEAAWRPVPPGDQGTTGSTAKITVTLDSGGPSDVAVFYRYRLGAIR